MSLDQTAIVTLGDDMLKSDATPAFILKSLTQLRTGFKASEEILRQTKIGVTVSKFRQHRDPEVQKQSQALVKQWRQAVQDDKRKGKSNGGDGKTGTSSGTATPSAVSAPSPAVPAKNKVPPEKRDAQTDGVNTSKNGDVVRDSCLKLMYNGLAFMSEEGECATNHSEQAKPRSSLIGSSFIQDIGSSRCR